MKLLRDKSGYFIEGENNILLTAPHAKPPFSDLKTGKIVQIVCEKAESWGLIGNISRSRLDLNRMEGLKTEFRKMILKLIRDRKIKFIFDIHGTIYDFIDLGAGDSFKKEYLNIVKSIFENKGFDVRVNYIFKGKMKGTIASTYNNALQIEIGYKIRKYKFNELIDVLVKIVEVFENY